jgi:CDP-glucose 4,6-dehydratase
VVSVRGDLQDYFLLERILCEYEIDIVLHLGAQTIVTTAQSGPVGTFKSNIEGTWNLLEACRRYQKVKAMIVASTDKAYGPSDKLPYQEEDPLLAEGIYDVSKSCADMIAHAYARTYQLPVCVTRCANLFGGGDLNFNRIIPGTIKAAFFDEELQIRSDGNYLREYFYVKDVVAAYLQLAEKMMETDLKGETFNFGGDYRYSVIEIVDLIAGLMKAPQLKRRILNQAEGEIRDQYLDSAKASKLLGWKPQWKMEEALKETINWYEEYFRKINYREETAGVIEH